MPVDVTYKEPILQVRDVHMRYGDKVVLDGINATILDIVRNDGKCCGQRVAILGPSGIGKTQLFRIMAGLLKPTSGEVLVGEHGIPIHAGLVGVVFQGYPLFPHRTVWSNLMLAAQQKEHADGAREAVHRYLALFDLADKARSYPAELSGGQRQRIAIAQQLLASDHVVLMDEPFSGLDMMMLEKTAHLINDVADLDELNTIVLVTHDISAACSVADHLWLLGRDRDAAGNVVSGAKIKATYNLIERDLCWHPEILTMPAFTDFVREIREVFRTL